MKVTDKYIFFWNGWPSNWYDSYFTADVEGEMIEFFSTEQYFMYKKAIEFGDYETADKILNCQDSRETKKLGRKVKNYDDGIWAKKRFNVMVEANILKYTQNPKLKEALLLPERRALHYVEASPSDGIWGIKMYEDEEGVNDEKNWKGENLLGKALDVVRDILIKSEEEKCD